MKRAAPFVNIPEPGTGVLVAVDSVNSCGHVKDTRINGGQVGPTTLEKFTIHSARRGYCKEKEDGSSAIGISRHSDAHFCFDCFFPIVMYSVSIVDPSEQVLDWMRPPLRRPVVLPALRNAVGLSS